MLRQDSYAYVTSSLTTTTSTRRGHVSASRMNDKVLLLCSNLERVPARRRPRLEGDEVLVTAIH